MFVNWKRLLLAVYRLEEGQKEILAKLEKLETPDTDGDMWMQKGIDNILSFGVNKQQEG